MRRGIPVVVVLFIGIFWAIFSVSGGLDRTFASGGSRGALKLPEPRYQGAQSVEEALKERRSTRSYKDEPLSLEDVSQLLWSAQGITNSTGFRAAPSAGALFPLEVYIAAGNVQGLPGGVYKYDPRGHGLAKIAEGDVRAELAQAALGQGPVREAAIDIVFSAVYERTTRRYGQRGVRYVHMEAGHAAQNVSLQAVPLGLGTVVIGAFDDVSVKRILRMPPDEEPLYILPVGRI